MSILSKHVTRAGGPPVDTLPLAGIVEQLPGVLEFLTADTYPDGQIRKRSTLMVFVEDGTLKACLNDRDAERTLWRSGQSLEDVLLAIEVALVEPGTDWRRSSSGNQKPRTKK